jgi:hypothetical protein
MALDNPDGSQVRVEVVDLESLGSRQIGAEERVTALLQSRAPDIREAISEVSEIASGSLETLPARREWQVKSLSVSFGLTLTAEAGVVVTKASAGASFSVTLTVERGQSE